MTTGSTKKAFQEDCTQCQRLADFLVEVKQQHPDYFSRPVPPFGDKNATLLVVGLAPGKHGANASGRPFTGDYAGILLYETLYRFGFANKPESKHLRDGLVLQNCRITNAVKCLPPENKPTSQEVNTCNQFLANELNAMQADSVIIALGSIAHKSVIKSFALRQADYAFGHCVVHSLPRPDGSKLTLIDSYHCSRYNTQTKRLTNEMFYQVFEQAKQILAQGTCV